MSWRGNKHSWFWWLRKGETIYSCKQIRNPKERGDTFQVLVVPEITASIQTHITAAKLPHLRHLKLTHHSTEDEAFHIELLIDAD